jgi:hypothetical protein
MHKYIIFQADKGQDEGALQRKLEHTQAMTWILSENWDSSDRPIPEPGYRPEEFVPSGQSPSSHYRSGDWVVDRVETYSPDLPMGKFDLIVMCYCKFDPVELPLRAIVAAPVSIESFGGDVIAYEAWLVTQDQPVNV